MRTNLPFQYGVNEWDAVIDDYYTDFALVKKSQPAYNLMKLKSGREIIYEDSTSALFTSQDWSQFDKLRNGAADFTPPPPNEFFP